MTAVTFRTWALTFVCLFGAYAVRASDSLYARLGGTSGIRAIADTLIDRIVADPVAGPSFKDSKLDRIKQLLAEQICDLSGGPCRYSGDSMKDVHAGHRISEAQFYRMVDALRDILQERHLDRRSTNKLLRLLAPMKRDVVEHGAARAAPARTTSAAAP
jgi:hemoglobin